MVKTTRALKMYAVLLVVSSLVLQTASCSYPKQVNVDDALSQPLEHCEGRPCKLPFINSRSLLDILSATASRHKIRSALVIVGPQNSGKSEAIQVMIPAWTKAGHTVIDIDLKGSPKGVHTSRVMTYVSKIIQRCMDNLKFRQNECIRKYFTEDCQVFLAKGLLHDAVVTLAGVLESITSTFLPSEVATQTILTLLSSMFMLISLMKRWKILSSVGAMVLLAALVTPVINVFTYFVPPLNASIAAGSWETLTCTGNAISHCAPERRLVLLVREFENLDDDSLQELLQSLQKRNFTYPVILETSDFLWVHEASVQKSSFSLQAFYVQEMTFSEGKADLVDKYQLFTLEEYQEMYDAVGGHCGAYSVIYGDMVEYKTPINESILHLKYASFEILQLCVSRHYGDLKEFLKFLTDLKSQDYCYDDLAIPPVADILMECNVLFKEENGTIHPQNRLMIHAIERWLSYSESKIVASL